MIFSIKRSWQPSPIGKWETDCEWKPRQKIMYAENRALVCLLMWLKGGRRQYRTANFQSACKKFWATLFRNVQPTYREIGNCGRNRIVCSIRIQFFDWNSKRLYHLQLKSSRHIACQEKIHRFGSAVLVLIVRANDTNDDNDWRKSNAPAPPQFSHKPNLNKKKSHESWIVHLKDECVLKSWVRARTLGFSKQIKLQNTIRPHLTDPIVVGWCRAVHYNNNENHFREAAKRLGKTIPMHAIVIGKASFALLPLSSSHSDWHRTIRRCESASA